MWQYQSNDELYHHGILGMKWGVRRGSSSTSKGSRKKSRMSVDAREVHAIKKKKISQMSNEELQKANKRLNLEQNYKKLNPSLIKRGTSVLAASVALSGTALALYGNSGRMIDVGKKIASGMLNVGHRIYEDFE